MNRLAEGYEPRWDIDSALGRQGELFVQDVAAAMKDGSCEVKYDQRYLSSGNVYVEHECCYQGRWLPSGIATSQAELWCFVLGFGHCCVVVPTSLVRTLHQRAIAKNKVAECTRGSHPTKGALINVTNLIGHAAREAA